MVRSLFISTTLVVLTFLLLAQSASAQGILELTLYEGCYFGHTMDTREAYCKIEDGSAIIVNSFHQCRSLCEDAGVYPPDVIQFGCTNERASNYDPNATDDDLSCVYERGCTDPAAIN